MTEHILSILEDDESKRVILDFMEQVGAEGIDEDSLTECVTPLFRELAVVKMSHSLYNMYSDGLLKLVLSPSGEAAFVPTDRGRQAVAEQVEVEQDVIDEINDIPNIPSESEEETTVYGLTAKYWINKWLTDFPNQSADDLVFYLAERGFVIDRM